MNSRFQTIHSLLLALQIDCGLFLVTMGPLQSSLMHFLFKGKISKDDVVSAPVGPNVHGEASNVLVEVCRTPIMCVVADSVGSNALKLYELALSLQSDCVLLNALSTPIAATKRASNIEIVDLAIVLPLHATARQQRRGYKRN